MGVVHQPHLSCVKSLDSHFNLKSRILVPRKAVDKLCFSLNKLFLSPLVFHQWEALEFVWAFIAGPAHQPCLVPGANVDLQPRAPNPGTICGLPARGTELTAYSTTAPYSTVLLMHQMLFLSSKYNSNSEKKYRHRSRHIQGVIFTLSNKPCGHLGWKQSKDR